MKPFVLEDYKELFKNEKSYKKFMKKIEICIEKDLSTIIFNDRVVGSFLSERSTKNFLIERVFKKLVHMNDKESVELMDKFK